MFIGGLVFLAGAIINAAAVNIAMLIIGRILLGIGVGFANQVKIKSLNLFIIIFSSLSFDEELEAFTITCMQVINFYTSKLLLRNWRLESLLG